MNKDEQKLTVSNKMAPAFIAYLAEIFFLFSLLVPVEKGWYSISLWEASYGHTKFIYVVSSLLAIVGIIAHLLEFGGPPKFRNRTIISLGLVALLRALTNIDAIVGLNKEYELTGSFSALIQLSIVCYFTVAITDFNIRYKLRTT